MTISNKSIIPTKLNFGCGGDIRSEHLNVDVQKGNGIDKVFDFNKFPYPLKADQFDYVFINNVLEHLLFPDRCL